MNQTEEHIELVRRWIGNIVQNLVQRGIEHDKSKLESPEKDLFDSIAGKMSGVRYGSSEYEQHLRELAPAIEHHYQHNDHHPEHFQSGIDDMNLMQICEMWCDWMAATKRNLDSNIVSSIRINARRFNLSKQLFNILLNTARTFNYPVKGSDYDYDCAMEHNKEPT